MISFTVNLKFPSAISSCSPKSSQSGSWLPGGRNREHDPHPCLGPAFFTRTVCFIKAQDNQWKQKDCRKLVLNLYVKTVNL